MSLERLKKEKMMGTKEGVEECMEEKKERVEEKLGMRDREEKMRGMPGGMM